MPNGKWDACVLSTFDANKFGLGHTRPHPTAKLLMRLFRKDAVAFEHKELGTVRAVIATMDKDRVALVPSNEGNVDARRRAKTFSYKFISLGAFKKNQIRKLGVDRLGRVTDRGVI